MPGPLDAPVVIAGVDGCRGGWAAFVKPPDGGPAFTLHSRIADLVDSLPSDAVVAVDMPIGLPERSARGGRGPEALVRPLLGDRQSSVFSIPSRAAVYAATAPFTTVEAWHADHRAASAVALQTSDPPRGVSIQAFGLFAKIRELDALLRARPDLTARVVESHPELAFRELAGGQPMRLPKKVRNRASSAGLAERVALLAGLGFDRTALERTPPAGAASDDILDAAAMLFVAARHARGETRSYPDPPGIDAFGLPMAIWV